MDEAHETGSCALTTKCTRNPILQLFPQGKPHMNQPPCFQSAQMIIRAQQMLWQTFPSSTLADR